MTTTSGPAGSETVLVVEDDDGIRRSLRLALVDEGYAVHDAATGEQGLEILESERVGALIVDLNLPGISGFEVCRRARALTAAPILIVSAREDSHDVVAGLEAGADDYITKPFVFKELAARLRANLRRVSPTEADTVEALVFGDLRISIEEGRVVRGNDELALTATEFRLLSTLASNAGRVLSREQILEMVWGYDHYGDLRLVDAHVRRLRTKIELDPSNPDHLVTVRGLGYRFESM